MRIKFITLSNITLLTALTLSTIAAWYSISGLTAIFAAAVIPIIIMGGALEFAKVITTVWLHRHWDRVSLKIKFYLSTAVVALAFLTSMGIYGFLSKAHIDQGIPAGDVAAKVSLLDEKIKIQRENIEVARQALTQMNAQVDQRLGRSASEQGAERAVVIRRQQSGERNKLQKEIADAQKEISKLNEERAPIASELRKVEAEVGPIKYIAALVYGDDTDQATLEKAVRWVIILIVLVFDPLALTLVIAANGSRKWEKEREDDINAMAIAPPDNIANREFTPEEIVALDEPVEEPKIIEPEEEFDLSKHAYLNKPWKWFPTGALHVPNPPVVEEPKLSTEPTILASDDIRVSDDITINSVPKTEPIVEVITEGVTQEAPVEEKPYIELAGGYVHYNGKTMHLDVLKNLKPEFFMRKPESTEIMGEGFGTKFPEVAKKGATFVRVDILPNRVYKFDGNNWIEVKKHQSDTYLHNAEYIKHLVEKIEKGEYDIELLSEIEKEEIAQYLKKLDN
jgi:hypothetical protein